MVVDKYVGRCLDVGSTPTGSIIPLHSFAFLGKTLLNQRFLFLSLVFLGILLRKRSHRRSQKQTLNLKKGYKKGYNVCRILKIYVLCKAFSNSNIPLYSFANIGFFVVISLIGFLIVFYQRNSKS